MTELRRTIAVSVVHIAHAVGSQWLTSISQIDLYLSYVNVKPLSFCTSMTTLPR